MKARIDLNTVRVSMLNAGVILVFGSSWVAYLWPNLTGAAIAAAVVVVIAEMAMLYVMAKYGRTTSADTDHSRQSTRMPKAEDEALAASAMAEAAVRDATANYYRLKTREDLLRPRASRSITWALGPALDSMPPALEVSQRSLGLVSTIEQNLLPVPMESWRVSRPHPDVFSVEAGIFDIQFIRGIASIVILDPSRVMVMAPTQNYENLLPEGEIVYAQHGQYAPFSFSH